MRTKLEFQADRIEAVLSLHKVPARVTGGTVTPRWVRFQVLPAVGAKISKIRNLSEELAAALDAPSCRISRRGAAVAIEIPRDDPQSVRLLPLYEQLLGQTELHRDIETRVTTSHPFSIPPVTAILGLAEDGAPLLIRLPSPDVAHILVAGTTGSGKTVLLQAMILSLAMTNPPGAVSVVLVDPRGHAFDAFGGLPHLARRVIHDVEETTEALHSLTHLMDQRTASNHPLATSSLEIGQHTHETALYREGEGPTSNPHIVVVIDNLEELVSAAPEGTGRDLTRLTSRGHGVGIHVVAATGNVDVVSVSPGFPVRLVGRVTSAEDARTASGWSGTGAERLLGRGDFIAVAEGRVTRFQSAFVNTDEIREVVGRMRDGEWRTEDDRSRVLTPPLASSRPLSLPWPVSQLTGVRK